ncbi:hypothetical protein ACFXKG_17465 [Streptomyces sp. NPDC059255]|uniref:hypothetical protein n=1 Tax=Streptomyces sp. NPDC059255 TaxID=3346793 RepID=UPI0036885F0C
MASSADPRPPATTGRRPPALVYRGPAALPGCPEAVAALLAAGPWRMDVRYVGPDEALPLTAASLDGALLYAQPGGGGLDEAYRHLERHREAMRGYVRGGGRYLGFCLGGYLAGSGPGFALLPGDPDQYITSPDATVHDERDTIVEVAWRGRPRSLYFQDGPYFTRGDAPGADVLATYPNGTVAALTARFGGGRVGVVGPHPEATDDWFTDVGLPVLHTRDMGVDLVNAVLA